MEKVIGRWLVIDSFHVAALALWWWVLLASNAGILTLDLAWLLEGFFFVGVVTILADYWLNREFYFDIAET
jgi:hypothetical protein